MYSRLFTWMVGRITGATSRPAEMKRYIGLLDVYGFEFFDVNSFEQLCINFANEKLQQFFLVTVFTAEEQVYKDEGVPWTPIPYADNKLVISIIEEQPEGIYPTLDSMCRTGNSTGRQFCAALHEIAAKRKAKDKKFDVLGAPKINRKESRTKEDHFLIKHFAADVVYHCGEFLEKNNDSLDQGLQQMVLNSSKPIIVEVCTPEAEPASAAKKGPAKKGTSSFGSVGTKFCKSLNALMKELESSQAHFIRCIKPNPELVPKKIHGEQVISRDLTLNTHRYSHFSPHMLPPARR